VKYKTLATLDGLQISRIDTLIKVRSIIWIMKFAPLTISFQHHLQFTKSHLEKEQLEVLASKEIGAGMACTLRLLEQVRTPMNLQL